MKKGSTSRLPINEFCPVRQTLRLLGKRWTLLILKEVYYSKKKRLGFMEVKTRLGNVSTKVLSERLKEMVGDGLLRRRVYSKVKPVKVDYILTEKGRDACDIIEGFKAYGLKWGGKGTFDCKRMDCELCSRMREEG
ncbi:MAG: helix-turn-helix domain-containing protein [Candidatus Altiarchaeota archaeon]